MDNYCFRAGSCGERDCPSFCLCVESCLCVGPGMSSSRIMIMDQYGLRSDPCDNRIIRLTNCLQILSWSVLYCISTSIIIQSIIDFFNHLYHICSVCDIMAIFMRELQHLAHVIHVVAQIVFYTTLGCMAAQVNYEVDFRRATNAAYQSIPTGEVISEQVIYGQAEIIEDKPIKKV